MMVSGLAIQPDVKESVAWNESYGCAHFLALLVIYLVWTWNLKTETKVISSDATDNKEILKRPSLSEANTSKSDLNTSSRAVQQSAEQQSLQLDGDRTGLIGERELGERFPLSTPAERNRFLAARFGDVPTASKQLQSYLQWWEKHQIIRNEVENLFGDTDEDDWNLAATTAMIALQENNFDNALPRLGRMYQIDADYARDKSGARILHFIPGQLDPKLADHTTYALACALYVDRKLKRESHETLTVMIDVRGGFGWPNIMPHRQLPFIQTVTKLLLALFPERCNRCLLYPMPSSALWIWNLVKVWIDPVTSSRMCLLSGPATIRSTPPFSQMEEHLTNEMAHFIENKRQAEFLRDEACEL